MKIVLTHGYFLGEDEKEQQIMRPYVPLGILYVSAWLEKHGYATEVFDSTFSSFAQQQEWLLAQRPDVLAVYTNLMTKLNVLRLIRFVRSQPGLAHTRIVLGGPEVRNHLQNFLQHGADFIVIGEGEQSMLELVQRLDTGSGKDLKSIPGLAFMENGKLCQTAEREKLKDLDELPMPARHKVDLQLYFDAWKKAHGLSAASISTMRGCPYTCKWCSRAVYGQSYRRRSAKHVADEIAHIKKNYDVDTLWFVDDVFTVSHKWLKSFREEMEARQLNVPFECITRSDRMNEEVLRDLKASGCFRVWIGAESGSQRIIDRMDRRVDVNNVREMIHLAKSHGLQAGTFIMVGYPGETEADIAETLRHLKRSDPDLFTITIAYPIKGTGLYEEVESRFLETLPWESSTDRDIDFHRTYPRRYYSHAVSMIIHEVNALKAWKRGNWLETVKLKLRALLARAGMRFARRGLTAT